MFYSKANDSSVRKRPATEEGSVRMRSYYGYTMIEDRWAAYRFRTTYENDEEECQRYARVLAQYLDDVSIETDGKKDDTTLVVIGNNTLFGGLRCHFLFTENSDEVSLLVDRSGVDSMNLSEEDRQHVFDKFMDSIELAAMYDEVKDVEQATGAKTLAEAIRAGESQVTIGGETFDLNALRESVSAPDADGGGLGAEDAVIDEYLQSFSRYSSDEYARQKVLARLHKHGNIYAEFLHYAKTMRMRKDTDAVCEQNYTAARLMRELDLSPTDAYLYLAYLEEEPEQAIRDLKAGSINAQLTILNQTVI